MPEAAERIALLILDDHALFRESVARLLDQEPDIDVVGHVGSIDEARAILGATRVDLVLLDFDLGQDDGLDFMRGAMLHGADVKILVVTAGIGPAEASALIRAGVSGIFLKRDSADSLVQSIREAAAGKVTFQHEHVLLALNDASPQPPGAPRDRFTDRERQVLSCVFEGFSNKEIGARLGVSESAVKATLQQLFAKTGVRTRSQLVRIVLEQYKHSL